jgi:hypothetical protein
MHVDCDHTDTDRGNQGDAGAHDESMGFLYMRIHLHNPPLTIERERRLFWSHHATHGFQ